MSQWELDELFALTEIDRIGKEYYDQTGNYLSAETMDKHMILQLIEKGELSRYVSGDSERLEYLVQEASEVLNQEAPFFSPENDVSIRKTMRYITGFYHTHHYFEIQCILEGDAEYAAPGVSITVTKNDLIFVPPNTVHSIYVFNGGTAVNIGIRKSTFEKAFRDILASNQPISRYFRNAMAGKRNDALFFRDSLDDFSLQLLLMMYRQQKVGTSEANKINDHLAQSFMYYVAEKSTDETIFGSTEYLQDKIGDIHMYMLENYRAATLTALAQHFHYSESYLSRLIHCQLGLSFSQLLQSIRLDKSCDLLINTDMKITELCEQIGYDNESYYINIFRKTFGITPLQYRKKYRRQECDPIR